MTRDEIKVSFEAVLDGVTAKQYEEAAKTGNREFPLRHFIEAMIDHCIVLCEREYERGLSESIGRVN